MLRQHGEDDLAERALSLSDDELARIGTLSAYYAFSEDAMALGGSMGGTRALSLATIDVLENTGRDLRWSRTEWEREGSSFDRFAEGDVVRDRELRRHAAEQQIPADESERTLDTVDPPAWGPAPPDATPLIKRCHELRTKPLRDFTVEDLRIMIGQQVALNRLVPLALKRLRPDPLTAGDYYPRDLLDSVLRVDTAFWEWSPDLKVEMRKLAEDLRERFKLEPGLREVIKNIHTGPFSPTSYRPDLGPRLLLSGFGVWTPPRWSTRGTARLHGRGAWSSRTTTLGTISARAGRFRCLRLGPRLRTFRR